MADIYCQSQETCTKSLLFTLEQWELLRRLKRTGISKEQVCCALDELERLSKEFTFSSCNSNRQLKPDVESTNISNYNNSLMMNSSQNLNTSTNVPSVTSPSVMPINNSLNGMFNSNVPYIMQAVSVNKQYHQYNPYTVPRYPHSVLRSSPDANNMEDESRELREFLAKGDNHVYTEISAFVCRNDLKQSQIAKMAGVNQAYISKFLRGELYDLSENGRQAICRWFLRTRKVYSPIAKSNDTYTSEPVQKLMRMDDGSNNFIASMDAPRRTRFCFKAEHLEVLEKSFVENPYPDPRKREELARLCNEARCRVENLDSLPERERVTEQIITHWFQNKRKLTKKDLSSSGTSIFNVSQDQDEYMIGSLRYDEYCQKPDHSATKEECQDHVEFSAFVGQEEPGTDAEQLAAYKAIMSRSNCNEKNVKSEPEEVR